jgi:hypothetical protein
MNKKTVVAIFDERADAKQAVQALLDEGFQRESISLLTRRLEDDDISTSEPKEPIVTGEKALHSSPPREHAAAKTGVATGSLIGGMGGLLLGLGALAVPGVGMAVVAGPLAATLLGAGIGAVVGGLVGALVDLGVPEEEAHIFSEAVRRGSTLVAVTTDEQKLQNTLTTLRRFEPVDIERRAAGWRSEGWIRFDHTRPPLSENVVGKSSPALSQGDGLEVAERRDDWMHHFITLSAGEGHFKDFVPAYQFGHGKASEESYRDRSWDDVKNQVKADWARRHSEATWPRFEPAIQHGFRSHSYIEPRASVSK